MRVFSIARAPSLPAARVLAAALADHHPGTRLEVLALGPTQAGEPFDVVSPLALGLPELRTPLLHEWPATEQLAVAALLRRGIEESEGPVLYLDTAMDVVAPLDPLLDALHERSLVITPRLLGTLPDDGRRPQAEDLFAEGRMDPGCLAARRGAEEPLGWWQRGVRAAQRAGEPLSHWLDLLPARFAAVTALDDPGMGASGWNLQERPLRRDRSGGLLAGGGRLRTVRFGGFRPTHPHWLADGADRVRVPDDPLLAALCRSYARRLLDAGWADASHEADLGRPLANGMPFDERMRNLQAEALMGGEDLGDVFSAEGTEGFLAWLRSAAPAGAGAGINRYLYRVWRERPDLAVAYPDLDEDDGIEFAGWCWVFGQVEMGIPAAFLPPRPPGIEAEPLLRAQEGAPAGHALAVNVAGYFSGTLGIGAAARLYLTALEAAGIQAATTTVEVRLPGDAPDAPVADYGRVRFSDRQAAGEADFNIVCVNPDELDQFTEVIGEDFFARRPSIGVWAWETNHVPERWWPRFAHFDELWVYTRFVAENIGRVAPIPVVPMPIPIIAPDPRGASPRLDLPEGFRFLYVFDFFSTAQRKNPLGAIEAFTRAFAPGEGPHLVLKSLHAHHRPQAYDALRWAIGDREDIVIVDASLPIAERDALMASCDCYVSLHRSEGFGLTPAECMAIGKPVIATAYGGVLDFMTPSNAHLVGWSPTRVGPEGELYPPDGTWAEPDLDHAAALMRRVVERPAEAAAMGQRARIDIARQLSPGAVGTVVRERLERLARRGSRAAAR